MSSPTVVTELGGISPRTIADFCALIGDPNPVHNDARLARTLGFPDVVVPGSLLATIVLVEAEAAFGAGFDVNIKFKRWVFAEERLILSLSDGEIRLSTGDRVCVIARLRESHGVAPESRSAES